MVGLTLCELLLTTNDESNNGTLRPMHLKKVLFKFSLTLLLIMQ